MPDDDEILLGRLRAKYGGGGGAPAAPVDNSPWPRRYRVTSPAKSDGHGGGSQFSEEREFKSQEELDAYTAPPEDPDAVHLKALAAKYAPTTGPNLAKQAIDRPPLDLGGMIDAVDTGDKRMWETAPKSQAEIDREDIGAWEQFAAEKFGPAMGRTFSATTGDEAREHFKTQADAKTAEYEKQKWRIRLMELARTAAHGATAGQLDLAKTLPTGNVSDYEEKAGRFHEEAGFGDKLLTTGTGLAASLPTFKPIGAAFGAVGLKGAAKGAATLGTYGAIAAPEGERTEAFVTNALFATLTPPIASRLKYVLEKIPAVQRSAVLSQVSHVVSEGLGGAAAGQIVSGGKSEAEIDAILFAAISAAGGKAPWSLNRGAAETARAEAPVDRRPTPLRPGAVPSALNPEGIGFAPTKRVIATDPRVELNPEGIGVRPAERPVGDAPPRPVEAPAPPVEAPPAPREPVAPPPPPTPAQAGKREEDAAPEAPAAPREEVIQPKAGEPPPKSPETAPPGESPESVSIKNRLMNRDRVARGLGEIRTEFKETFKEWGDEAMDLVAENPRAAEAVVDKLAKSMQSPDKVESALLTIRRVDLNRDLLAADAKGRAAGERGDKAGAEEAKIEADAILEKFAVLDDIGLRGGAEAGRNLAARKMEMAHDYSLVKMENDLRREQGYKKLTPEESSRQMAETKRLHDELAKAVADRDAWKARVEEIEARKGKSRAAPGPKAPEYGKANKVVTREAYEATKVAVREKLNRLSAGIDPTLLVDLAKMGAFHVEAGARNFAAWAKAMKDDLGEKVEPHLEAVWNEAHKQIKAATFAEVSGKVTAGLKAGKPLAEMKGAVDKIALQFEREGVKDRAELIDKVHEVLKGIDPTITRRDTQVVLAGYGKDFVTKPSDDPAKLALREHKGETQQDLKLEDMAAGKPPERSGPQRQPPGDVLRELIKQVNDAKRKGGYGTPDPATSLRTAMDAVKTRLRHELVDLQRQIDAGKKDIAKRTALTYDAEATALREQRDALKEVYNSVFGKSELTPEQRTEIALKAIKKSNADLEARAAAGDVFPAERVSKTPETPELKALRDKRAALQQRIKDIREAAIPRGKTGDEIDAARKVKEAKAAETKAEAEIRAVEKSIEELKRRVKEGDVFSEKVDPVQGPLEERMAGLRAEQKALREQAADMRAAATPRESWSQIAERAREARLTKQAATLERRLETGQLEAPARRPTVPPTPEAIRLEARVDTLKRAIAERVFRAKLANRNKVQKAAAAGFETIATARALMTSLDFSAVLRQGGFIALGHPKLAVKAMGAMFKASGITSVLRGNIKGSGAAGREAQARSEAEIRLRPTYRLAKRSGLYLSEHGDTAYSKLEEAYMGRWAEKVPGIAGSQRAYTTFLNRLRMDSFDAMVRSLSKDGTPTPQEANAIANYVNVATGRGGAKDSKFLIGMNGILFSPRLMASRFQLLLRPLSGFRQGGETSYRVRKMVAGEYARFLGGVIVMYGLGLAAGAEIEHDPRSSAFGKMRWKGDNGGDTYVDGLAGLAQATTLTARMVTGETKEKPRNGGREKVRSLSEDVGYGKSDAWDVFVKFMRSKLAPVPAAIVDVRSGTDVNHQKTTVGGEVAGLVTPMLGRDVYEAMVEQGIPKGTAFGILSMFGMSIQTHEKRRRGK